MFGRRVFRSCQTPTHVHTNTRHTNRSALNFQVRQLLHWARQHRLAAFHHQRALDDLGMRGHEADQFVVGEFTISGQRFQFLAAHRLVGLEAGAAQDALQFVGRRGMLEIVDGLEFNAFLGQDTPDLAAGASGGLLINGDLVAWHGCSCFASSLRCHPERGEPERRRNRGTLCRPEKHKVPRLALPRRLGRTRSG